MNFRFITRQLGLLSLVLTLSILAVACWGVSQWMRGHDTEAMATTALLATVAIGAVFGVALCLLTRGGDVFLGRREALLLVALTWLLGAVLAAAPYLLWAHLDGRSDHPFHRFINCYFEAMSGLSTTGASVLGDAGHTIEALPRTLLLWRALTHWLGGLGIVVLFVAVLPTVGVGGKKLFQIEAPGPKAAGVRPRIRETARVLWLIYLGLTIAQITALLVAGADPFDAVCHTFATLATGGFSTYDTGIGGRSTIVQVIIIVFMVLAGVNFGLYYQLIRRRFRQVWTDSELRLYLGILFVAAAIVVTAILHRPIATTADPGQPFEAGFWEALRHGVFQVASIQTTTGFCTVDFDSDTWDFIAKAVLVVLMFIGASAGSTGGGIKVIRILIAFKVLLAEIERVFRPNVVRTIKIGGAPVNSDLRQSTIVYILSIVVLFLIGAALLMLLEPAGQCTFTDAATASAATLNNIGPGLGRVGAVHNYGWFTDPSKVVLILLMVMGRLEMYAILVLFTPRFWKGD